jgi:preprotein translocase subunit SecD
VLRIDDTIDPFAAMRDEAVPDGQGAGIYQENAPIGGGKTVLTHYVRVVSREGEATSAAIARIRPWLATIRLPPGARFGFEPIEDYDEDTRKSTEVGFRTFVLVGEPVLRTEDVTEAAASMDSSNEVTPDLYVAVTLSSVGAKRFGDATREWTQRRMAILVDDVINSAPVIRTVIAGGRISITLGRGDPEQKMVEARHLARALGGGR